MIRIILAVILFMPFAARAATCDAGYYLLDGECKKCNPNNEAYYCPGDDARHPCPITNTDYNQFGYTFTYGREGSWAPSPTASSAASCRCTLFFKDEYGNQFLLETTFNGTNYWGDRRLWYKAGPGFYLSEYDFSSDYDWYSFIKTCTNAPAHAHYTGPGTPDEPKSGGATDYNDCPWECDDGYGRHDGACAPLCTSGVRHIKTGGGLAFNLYPVAYSSPALAVRNNGIVCYGILVPGAMTNTININHAGIVYHVEN